MKILVLGAGAVGGYFGGRLAEAGADVTFLVRPRRQQQLSADGLRVLSPLGDISQHVTTSLTDGLTPRFDAVLLTCKAYDLESAMEAVAGGVGRQTAIVPLLNGLAHLERLDARFGREHVMGGTCLIDSTLQADGTVVHGGTLQRFVFGERDGASSARAGALAAALQPSRIDWQQSPAIVQTMWDKIVFLAALATATCLFRGNVREIMAAPGGRAAVERALDANVAIAAAEGFPCADAAIAFARQRLTDPEGLHSASMMRDLEAGGLIESDHIVGWMLERARRHGIDDTMLALAYTHLKTYERRRAASRLPRG
jgi:2-dehydropantoate 2-reductase